MPFQSSEKTRQSRNSRLIKIVNGRIIRNHTIINDDVLYIHDGKIIDPQKHFFACGNPPDVVINAKGLLIAPGYIDVQINGAFGVDFSVWKGDKQMKEGLDKIAKGLVKYGCTSFVPTIVSSHKEVYHQVKNQSKQLYYIIKK